MVGYFLLWTSNAAGPILIVSISVGDIPVEVDDKAWMADWCPAPEERAIIVGVAVTFVFAIDAFANSELMYPFNRSSQRLATILPHRSLR